MKATIELLGETLVIEDGVITGDEETVAEVNRFIEGVTPGPTDGDPTLAALDLVNAPYKLIELIDPEEDEQQTVY